MPITCFHPVFCLILYYIVLNLSCILYITTLGPVVVGWDEVGMIFVHPVNPIPNLNPTPTQPNPDPTYSQTRVWLCKSSFFFFIILTNSKAKDGEKEKERIISKYFYILCDISVTLQPRLQHRSIPSPVWGC